jgi:CheY-like chemotaxis protein
LAGTRLLYIIDDDPEDSEFLTDALLNVDGLTSYLVFANGQELLDHLSSDPPRLPDIILLDINMPVKNGYETLKELKQENSFKTIPVVMLTASSNLEDEKYCYRLGCRNYLKKPLSFAGYARLAEEIFSLI